MNYIYKLLREFFRIFGKHNRLYKKFKDKANLKCKKTQRQMLENVADMNAYFLAYINFKQLYGIEIPAEVAGFGNKFELVRIKLKDIKRDWEGKIYSLKQCSPYKYLETGDKKIYENYIKKHINKNCISDNTAWDIKRFDDLFKSIKKTGYDPKKSVICVDDNNVIIDGQHRSCCLLYLYGGDYEINVVKVSRRK
jgi:hypothetical protein